MLTIFSDIVRKVLSGMKVVVRAERPVRVKSDALAVGLFSDGSPPASFSAVDAALGGVLADMRQRGEIRGRDREVTVVRAGKKLSVKRVIVVGLGERATFHPSSFAGFAGVAVRAAAGRKLGSVAVVLPEPIPFDAEAAVENAAEGAVMATFNPAPYRNDANGKPHAVASAAL